MTEKHRDETVRRCRDLKSNYGPYDFVYTNCESAAFYMESGRGGGNEGRFVTPQVPWLLYTMFRMSITTIGVICLHYMVNVDDVTNSTMSVLLLDLAFQVFTTLPIGLELTVHLVRSAVHLSPRKDILGRGKIVCLCLSNSRESNTNTHTHKQSGTVRSRENHKDWCYMIHSRYKNKNATPNKTGTAIYSSRNVFDLCLYVSRSHVRLPPTHKRTQRRLEPSRSELLQSYLVS